ncbi:MAG: DUF123 domain-containing protein [Gammaproteobacteria bacterium]|nr:DUF123 domain-containing protein [Gammaproteobacteria bacterium]
MHVRIGRTGKLETQPEFYVYVGSAHGPGEVRARVAHHQKLTPPTALAYRLPESRPEAPRDLGDL